MTDQTPPAPEPQRGLVLRDHLEPAEARAMALGDVFARSGMFGDVRQQAQAAVRIMLGQAIGLPPVVAMAQISVVEGRPSVGATAVGALLRNHGYDYRVVRRDEQACVLRFWRGRADVDGSEQLVPDVEFSIEDARRAELLGKKNWQRYPEAMMFARCMTAGARLHAPEVSAGLPLYDPDELRDTAGAVTGTVVDVPEPQPQPAARTTRVDVEGDAAAMARALERDEAAIAAENDAKVAAQPTPPEPVQDPEPPARSRRAEPPAADESPRVLELLGQGRDAIRDRAKSLGLSPSGTKLELARRIAEHEVDGPGDGDYSAQPAGTAPAEQIVDAEVVDEDAAKAADAEREPVDADAKSDEQLERAAGAGDEAAIRERAARDLEALGWRSVGKDLWASPPGDDDRALTTAELEALAVLDAEIAAPEPVDDGAEREPSDADLAAAERLAAEHPDLAGMPDVDAEPAGGGTEPLVSVTQRRQLFAKFREHELHDEAAQRALIEWVTGEQITERLTAAHADEVLDVVPFWKMQLAQLARAASAGDERAQAIYARHLAPREG